jgi:hypothetical protein
MGIALRGRGHRRDVDKAIVAVVDQKFVSGNSGKID